MSASDVEGPSEPKSPERSGPARIAGLLRHLGEAGPGGARLSALAAAAGLPAPTALRLLRALVAEELVDLDPAAKTYRLGLGLFRLAAKAGNPLGLRDLARPALLRLTGALGETVFLLVRSGYDAVCIDRTAGPLPIRSFTGDIGGRVMLGLGQGAMAILAHLPADEQEAVIRYNLPRIREVTSLDEAFLHTEIARTRALGYCAAASGLIPGMAGLGVPILDAEGRAVAALSVGSTVDRLAGERRDAIAGMLRREAAGIAARLNPFDETLRRAGAAMERPSP
ncbi:IclR family transcriptional regulator [Methylobacterium currus]|uniref:IclR family transcriptional regulator n=1 Tax=Methylobacterium currus TaxID=2051553 RepID=A0A2R4WH71_9HYPH|nr:IclR family transcriptional regulator [Methylobacterium currus]AWB20876.1 IclR family transcriptional regulator [Methylobacterium currus]